MTDNNNTRPMNRPGYQQNGQVSTSGPKPAPAPVVRPAPASPTQGGKK